jgi:hypothetical protein
MLRTLAKTDRYKDRIQEILNIPTTVTAPWARFKADPTYLESAYWEDMRVQANLSESVDELKELVRKSMVVHKPIMSIAAAIKSTQSPQVNITGIDI